MLKHFYWISLISVFFILNNVQAGGLECAIQSAQDILNCAVQRSLDVQLLQASLLRDENLTSAAKQILNPEFSATILSGQPGSPQGVFYDLGMLQTIELGGKRKNRKEIAQTQRQIASAKVLESREMAALQTALALYRLRQIQSELEVFNETQGTYRYILSNYKKRPRLAPEQEMNASVFGLAMDETSLNITKLKQEQDSLLRFLRLATGVNKELILSHLPSKKNPWPSVDEAKVEAKNAQILQASYEKNISESDLDLAKSNIWPDVKLGPNVQIQTGIPGKDTAIGGSIVFSLPIFNQNRGNVAFARREKERSELAYNLTLQKTNSEREEQKFRYEQALQSLSEIKSKEKIGAGHANLEKYFNAGLISAPLVIETHRQMIDLIESTNDQELVAIDSLWRIYILDGTFLNQKI